MNIWIERGIMLFLFVGCIIAIPFLMGEIAKQQGELENQITGKINPIYGDTGETNITVKDKFTSSSLIGGTEFYIVDMENNYFVTSYANDYINFTVGKTYHINWIYTVGKRIKSFEEIK
jgi:hypothetical protein